MKSLKYFFYYLIKTDWKKFFGFLKYAATHTNHSQIAILYYTVQSTFHYKISLLEYFYFRFFEKNKHERKKWAGTGYMYEYQLIMNPVQERYLVEDKLVFLNRYKEFIGRDWLDLNISGVDEIAYFLEGKTKIVLKNSLGQAGQATEIIDLEYFNASSLYTYSRKNNFNLLEEFVVQHKALMDLAPNSLNTLRIITQIINQEKVEIIGTILRLGNDRKTDNLSTGGLACSFDPETGIVNSNGVTFDIRKPDYLVHPVSRKIIKGFQIPYWQESIEMARKAALLFPQNKSVGWDIAIKNDGPILIEGNHNWGARLWQMPVKQGLKSMLIKYCK